MTGEILSALKETGTATKNVIEKNEKSTIEKGKQAGEKIRGIPVQEINEIGLKSIEDFKESMCGVMEKLNEIKNMTPEQLRDKLEHNLDRDRENFMETEKRTEGERDSNENVRDGLNEEEKARIKEETGWSDEIIEAIGSWKEYEIYRKAGLVEAEIGGKKCLIRNDIDWDQKDEMGRTNKERAEQGLSPINKDGKVIELHHIGQHANSPLAELTPEEHRGKGNDSVLHDKAKKSEIDRQAFAEERSEHWGARAQGSEAGE